ncbi:MAG: YebC/PmpR family DNA-binding transcriptional regulator [Candidatus Magasanikbacteria bacterium]|jgi:YebC/PmpR family DNA-binding regulatory protein|nr:YebC/PmpR family DNA-binding transcriptional regulator [Candidatus Magasanikbacteria bacterium]MBT4071111.1 YebC/PmpR family DNA-binding transcriptional regulator [Candidatus Magasanikbacteria bacterium]
MSGHSRWSKIQHKKGKTDKARSSLFTKLLRAITVAAGQGGGDVEMNFSLRIAVDKAKASNVPKDNIDRAIKKGSGEGKNGVVYEEGVYEGFGPGGVAILVEVLTDNRNRTASEVKHLFSKCGGSMGGPGSVQWQFEHLGIITLKKESVKEKGLDFDEFSMEMLDAGAKDIKDHVDGIEIITAKEDLRKVLDAVIEQKLEPEESGLEWIAKEPVEIDEELQGKIARVYYAFDENDDVKEIYTNVA